MNHLSDEERQKIYLSNFKLHNVELTKVQQEWSLKKDSFITLNACTDLNVQHRFKLKEYELDENSELKTNSFLADLEGLLRSIFDGIETIYIIFNIGFKEFFFKTETTVLIQNIGKMDFLLDYYLNISFISFSQNRILTIEDDESVSIYSCYINNIGKLTPVNI